ncbi:MAG: VOC family protein [Burkholderiaceae bacterium]|nr:VOC family protein [Microbacteriaceae bacterium]
MTLRWYSVVIDSHDIAALARWWATTLDWKISYEADDEVVIVPPRALDADRDIPVDDQGPGLVFVTVPEGKTVKNRLHLDLAPRAGDDQDAAVTALVERGASRVDVGQDNEKVNWVVLADPEGNEFCVLSPRD